MVNHAGLVNQKLWFLHNYACDLVSSDTLLTDNSLKHTDSLSVLKKTFGLFMGTAVMNMTVKSSSLPLSGSFDSPPFCGFFLFIIYLFILNRN